MPTLERWTPFRDLDRFERRMRRAIGDVGFIALAPLADVFETDAEYVVELEVPGFDEQELAVEITDHQLLVKGQREEETERTERTALLRERLERRFERTFELPLAADTEHISASYGKGVLTVHVPKTSTGEPHTIEITKE